MTKGGIFPCIIGTIYLSIGAMLFAFPLGIASAIYLNEYARQGAWLRAIRFGINNLAGVPSIVFGLFGLAFFVTWMKLDVSILSGALTLGILSLPVIIGTSEEALRSVPDTYREASLGLGATKWQTISRVVLPAALPSIITGGILAVSRAAGETAAIMFTAAVYYTTQMPLIHIRSGHGTAVSHLCAGHRRHQYRTDPWAAIRDRLGADCPGTWHELDCHHLPGPGSAEGDKG